MNPLVACSPEVEEALAAGQAVVALESTIISHGMPWPENLATAERLEAAVRKGGAVPATIAVFDGRIRVGLTRDDLAAFARRQDVLKLSRADLAYALSNGRAGATTVAATMICAAMAGIGVFATGGIGGVHRGAESTFDVSADLQELARTPVTVVSAGAKAILDLPKTLEVLETLGVPVIGYGTDTFPAFWSRDSGLKAPLRLDSAAQIARMLAVRRSLGQTGGVLIANPIPPEAEIARTTLEPAIAAALRRAEADGITGKQATPFLLAQVLKETGGDSLRANIALAENNARLAAAIAVACA